MGFKSEPMTTVTPLEDKSNLFTPEIRAQIDKWIAKYPEGWQQSAVMAALSIMQDENGGWLTEEIMNDIAAYLDMPPIAVYEVATFYSMYELKPVGRNKVCVCTNISCMINGSDKIVDHLESKLKVKLGETTADDKFTLKEVECLGACGGGPMMQIGKDYYENLTPEKVDEILDGLE
jgi:NADH-quinone oxidoreductase subunit E